MRPISSEVGRIRWLSGAREEIDKQIEFLLDGTVYEHADPRLEHAAGRVARFEHRTEPHVIAQIPLAGGAPIEIHGYATFY